MIFKGVALFHLEGVALIKTLLFALLLLIFANLIYLDIKLFFSPDAGFTTYSLSDEEIKPTIRPSSTDGSCPTACLTIVEQATASLSLAPPSIGGAEPVAKTQPVYSSPIKEFYIPLGSGKTTSSNWQDILGTDTTINTASYGKISQAFFEVSIYIPTGNGRVFARLYNVTDDHPAWFAESSTESKQPVLLSSAPIALAEGNKVYRVQLSSTLGAEAVMDFARVKIVVE